MSRVWLSASFAAKPLKKASGEAGFSGTAKLQVSNSVFGGRLTFALNMRDFNSKNGVDMKEFEFEGTRISSGNLEASLHTIYLKEIMKVIKITSSKIWLGDFEDAKLVDAVEKRLIELLRR